MRVRAKSAPPPVASQVPRLRRCLEPVVVATVHIAHGGGGKLGGIEIVEAGEVDGIVGAADRLDIAIAEGSEAAGGAEAVMRAHGAKLVVGEVGFAGDQPEGLGLDDGAPVSPLGADRAVALPGAGGEVKVDLEPHLAAVAASVKSLHHRLAFL